MSTYAERAAPAWIAGPVACVWSTRATGAGAVLPDACADLAHVAGRGAFVAGPDTGPVRGAIAVTDAEVTGLRLRPGHAAAALGFPAAELRDRRVALTDLWGARDPGRRSRASCASSGSSRGPSAGSAGSRSSRSPPATPTSRT
jgi:hypothetical protein